MMAFMVVSAVAFSMFMRQNRLPSSFLRQRMTSSQLVKAGLANAMREIDVAIGDNPYPGVGNASNRNYWKNRVFMGDQVAYNKSTDDDTDDGEDEDSSYETVSTLTLEALAYLPPSLVDTVRFWSRRTRTAAWAPLGYDAGRYAYTAVNVSDYLDINRLKANVMRDSSPSNRISLAFLFDKNNDEISPPEGVSPSAFDTQMKKVGEDTYMTRLVSLADYNLSVKYGDLASAGFVSPFCEYIVSPKDGTFYGATVNFAKMQKFVTDSWYPGSLTNTTALVLTDANVQPLTDIPEDCGVYDVAKSTNPIMKKLFLSERVALVDYIDSDNVPVSLVLPTAERTPMLTGLQIVPKEIAPSFTHEDEIENIPKEPPAKDEKWTHRFWRLTSFGENARLLIKGTALYPFDQTLGDETYSAEVVVKMVISKADESGFNKVRPTVKYAPTEKDWSKIPQQYTGKDSLWAFYQKGSVSIQNGIVSFGEIPLKVGTGFNEKCNCIFGIKFDDTEPTPQVKVETSCQVNGKEHKVNMKYRNASNGNADDVSNLIGAGGSTTRLKMYFFAWVRILDSNGNTVDLVPAQVSDDNLYNGKPKLQEPFASDWFGNLCNESTLPFEGTELGVELNTTSFSEKKKDFESEPTEVTGLRIYTGDPRYNFAPENWYAADAEEEVTGEKWWSAAKQIGMPKSQPRDFYQYIANNPDDILQSMGELYNIPLVRNSEDLGKTASGSTDVNVFDGSFKTTTSRYTGGTLPTATGQLADKDFMWKSRYPFGSYGDDTVDNHQDPFDWGILDTRGGVTVSPYAEKEILMAVIANTPNDWSTAYPQANNTLDQSKCLGPKSSKIPIEWNELKTIRDAIQSAIGDKTSWYAAYRDAAGWGCNSQSEDEFFGVDLGEDFHDVDRKFLYSYWKNCLGNDQQLFLIFVRAEPTVMGGGSAKQTPSQLGARAVALVWREPVSSISDTQQNSTSTVQQHPHRMRILFYHQFE